MSLNGPELRVGNHNRHDSYEKLAKKLLEKIGAKHFAVTLGGNEAFLFSKNPDVMDESPFF